MDITVEKVYELTQQLTLDERRQLAARLAQSPATYSVQTILNTLNSHANELREMGVEQIGVFGSHVHAKAKLDSDLDILVKMTDDNYSLFDLLGIKVYLEELFACEVDLVSIDGIKPAYRSEILNEVIYAPAVSVTP